MIASLAIGKALGSVEKMDDGFGLGDVDCPGMRGRRVPITTVSAGEASEGVPWGKNERFETGILRTSGGVSRDAVDDEGPDH